GALDHDFMQAGGWPANQQAVASWPERPLAADCRECVGNQTHSPWAGFRHLQHGRRGQMLVARAERAPAQPPRRSAFPKFRGPVQPLGGEQYPAIDNRVFAKFRPVQRPDRKLRDAKEKLVHAGRYMGREMRAKPSTTMM